MFKRGREGHCCCYCCWCWHVLTRAGLAYEWARHRRTKQVKSKSSRRKPTAQPRHARTHTHAHRDCEREAERKRDGLRARHAGRQALTRIGRMIRQESLLRGGRRRTRRRRRRRWKRRRQALRRSLYMRLFLHPLSTAAHKHTHTHLQTIRLIRACAYHEGSDADDDSDVDDFWYRINGRLMLAKYNIISTRSTFDREIVTRITFYAPFSSDFLLPNLNFYHVFLL